MNMLFVVAVVAIAIIAFYFYQQTNNTMKKLQANGYVIDETIPSNPRIVIDRQNRRVAVIYAGRYEEFSFDQLDSVRLMMTDHSDDENLRPRLEIRLKNHPKDTIKVRGREIQDVDGWLATLNSLKDS